MHFSTGLLASLAATQAVLSTPVPTPKTPNAVSVAISVVQSAQGTLDTQKTDLEDFISKDAVPFIKVSLGNIVGAIQDINKEVMPYVIGIVKPLTKDELANVLVLLDKTKGLLDGIKDYTGTLLSELSKESQKAIKAELVYLVSIIEPAIIPIETLAKNAVNQSTGGLKNQIKGALIDVKDTIGGMLGPIWDAIAKIL